MTEKCTILTARLTRGELRKLDSAAARSGRSRSETVRRLLLLLGTAEADKVLVTEAYHEPT